MSIRGSIFILITIFVLFYTFKKPKIGLYYFLFLLLLRDGYIMENLPDIYINWHIPMIAGWFIVISWFAHAVTNKMTIRKPIEIVSMIFLALTMWISSRYAQYPGNSDYMLNEYIRMMVLAFLIINIINTEKDMKEMAFVLISVITFLVLYAYYRYKTEGYDIAVPSLYYVDRNFFAESIVSILPLAFMFYEESSSKAKKLFFLGIVGVMAVGVILTYSRGGLLALGIVLVALFVTSRKKIIMLLVGIVMLISFLPHIGLKYTNRMSTVSTYEKDNSAMVRIATWRAGINMVKQKPWLGVGPGNFNDLFVSYAPEELDSYADYTMSIHNIFLQVFSETGLIGGGIFILIIISSLGGLYRINIKNKRLAEDKRVNLAMPNALGVSLLGFCGAGFFLPGAYYGYLYIIIPFLVASTITCKAQIKKALI